jgi:hypothetical protein
MMKAVELIAMISELVAEHGNIEVCRITTDPTGARVVTPINDAECVGTRYDTKIGHFAIDKKRSTKNNHRIVIW